MKTKPKIVLVRSKPHNIDREDQFLNGVISIGWPTSKSLAGLGRDRIRNAIQDHDVSEIDVSQVEIFVNLPKGSLILTPSVKTREIHLFKTIGEYEYRSEWADDSIGNPHTIPVKYIRSVPREVFDSHVQRALNGARKAVSNFAQYAENILSAINPAEDVQTASGQPRAEEAAREVLRGLLGSSDEKIRLEAAKALLGS